MSPPLPCMSRTPIIRPANAELDRIAAVLNAGKRIAIYGGSGCQGAHDQVVALADRLKAPVAHTSRAKDFLEYDNPFNVGMTGIFGTAGGFRRTRPPRSTPGARPRVKSKASSFKAKLLTGPLDEFRAAGATALRRHGGPTAAPMHSTAYLWRRQRAARL